jgi:ribosomal protein S27AE
MVTFCPKCGTQAVDDQSLFCNKCGMQLQDKSEEPEIPPVQPVIPTKKCPRCGAPVLDESRYYCKQCGAYVRTTRDGTVSVSEDSSGTKTPFKKPVIIPGIHQNAGTRTIIKPEPGVMKRKINLVNPMVKKMGILFFVLAIVVMVVWIGTTLLESGTVVQPDSDMLITQGLDSMTLTLNDFPPGWISSEAGGTEDVYSAQFFTASENNGALVEQTISRYPGIEEARLEFNSERPQIPGIAVESVNLGNEGFGYIDENSVVVIFRRGNVIIKIEDTRNEYQNNPSLDDAKKYAEIVAKRIR